MCTGLPVTAHAHDGRHIIITKDLAATWRKPYRLFFVGTHTRLWLSGVVPGIHRGIAQDSVRSVRPAAVEKVKILRVALSGTHQTLFKFYMCQRLRARGK